MIATDVAPEVSARYRSHRPLRTLAALIRRAFRRRIADTNRAFRTEVEDMSAQMVEMIRLIPVTRAHGVEDMALERVDQRLHNVRSAGIRLDSTDALFGGMSWVTLHAFNVACLLTAGYVYMTGILPITIGDVVLITGLFGGLSDAMLKLTELMPQIGRGMESIRSIGEVLESHDLEENAGKAEMQQVRGKIHFDQLGFTYPHNQLAAVQNITLTAEPGAVIAFVGASGAGKSTILNLLLGFVRPSAGRIVLDGQDAATVDMRSYRRHIAVVSQEPILFNGTVRENVCYGARDVPAAALHQALADADALAFVEQLAHGVDTLIGENGARLSGGQKQRLVIARALLRDPRVLLLDEPTSALDAASEAQIQAALGRLMRGRTTFIVAHRLATVRAADQIYVVEQGQIVEQGTHAALLAHGGVYARLCALQQLT